MRDDRSEVVIGGRMPRCDYTLLHIIFYKKLLHFIIKHLHLKSKYTVRWWSFNQTCKRHENDYHGIVVHNLGGHNSLCLKSYKFKIKKIKQMKKFKMLDVAQFFPRYKYYNLFAELRLAEMLQSAESSQYYTRCNNKCFLICSKFFYLLLTRDIVFLFLF